MTTFLAAGFCHDRRRQRGPVVEMSSESAVTLSTVVLTMMYTSPVSTQPMLCFSLTDALDCSDHRLTKCRVKTCFSTTYERQQTVDLMMISTEKKIKTVPLNEPFLKITTKFLHFIMSRPRRKGGNKCCFCLSVRLSVRHVRSKLIIRVPKGLVCRNLERKFPTLEVTLGTILQVR